MALNSGPSLNSVARWFYNTYGYHISSRLTHSKGRAFDRSSPSSLAVAAVFISIGLNLKFTPTTGGLWANSRPLLAESLVG